MTKLSVHAMGGSSEAVEFVRAGAPVVLFVDDFGAASEFLAINPNITLVGRVFDRMTAESQFERGLSPEAAVAEYFDKVYRNKLDLNPLIRIWVGHNEPKWTTFAQMAWYAQVEALRTRKLRDLGRRSVVGQFATGNPDITGVEPPGSDPLGWWKAFRPALDAVKECKGFLGLHGYWQDRLRFGLDANGEDFNTFRYRKVHRIYLEPNGFGDLPIIQTENGSDFRIWPNYNPDGYAADLIFCDEQMRKDKYLIGATIFTFNVGGNPDAWGAFNMVNAPGVMSRVLPEMRLPDSIPTPPPSTPPPVVTKYKFGDNVVITAGALNVRTEPDYTKNNLIVTLPKNTEGVVIRPNKQISDNGFWSEIIWNDLNLDRGWVNQAYVKLKGV